MQRLRPVMGSFETSYQKKAFKELQKALLASGIKIILREPDWGSPHSWTENEKIIPEMLSRIGIMYYEQVPDK